MWPGFSSQVGGFSHDEVSCCFHLVCVLAPVHLHLCKSGSKFNMVSEQVERKDPESDHSSSVFQALYVCIPFREQLLYSSSSSVSEEKDKEFVFRYTICLFVSA